MDTVDQKTRSRIMASVRPKGNRSTERRLRAYMVQSGLRGWKMHSKELRGTPDFYFPKNGLAIFVDGCFWHGCNKCKNIPKSNSEYWNSKIEENRKRDRLVNKGLRKNGHKVLRIWEHQIKVDPLKLINKIKDHL